MYSEINSDTIINKGDWVRDKSTGNLYQIGDLVDGKFEIKPSGNSTLLTEGIVFVADQQTLARKYEIRSSE